MKDIIDENFENILNVNWFKRVYWEYKRIDWIIIACYQFGDFSIVYPNWETINIKDKIELVWYLALNWLINRLI